jgi:hypothetical protein
LRLALVQRPPKFRLPTLILGDLCITLILAKIWEFTIDFIVKNLMKFANIELCRGLKELHEKNGAAGVDRTLDLTLTKGALYH